MEQADNPYAASDCRCRCGQLAEPTLAEKIRDLALWIVLSCGVAGALLFMVEICVIAATIIKDIGGSFLQVIGLGICMTIAYLVGRGERRG